MVQTGLQRLFDEHLDLVRGARVGVIANPTAIDRDFVHLVDRLAPHVKLTALFGPEHGIRGDAQDMISVEHGTREAAAPRDPRTGAAVYSLYGHTLESLTPTAAMLADLDVVIFDVQDVGARYYTFVWTMVLAMRACAVAGKRFIVLDRPNPIGGALVEGGAIAPGYESFVGLVSCPNRHGLTAGEIAAWRAQVEDLDVDLTIIDMRGWRRSMGYAATGLPWVLPSPNMPTVDTALVYPGMCLVEGSELSEARGTTRPFELAGAPWLDAEGLAAQLTAMKLPGVVFRPAVYTPMFQKHGGRACAGIQQHVADPIAYRPYLTGVAFLKACRDQDPARFGWRTKAYEFVDDIPAIDLLCGSAEVRTGIDAGASLADIATTWQAGQAEFVRTRDALLRYPA